MAGTNQIKISELPTKESPSANDYLVLDDGNETSRSKAEALNETLQQQSNEIKDGDFTVTENTVFNINGVQFKFTVTEK